ncbi:MAG: Rieske 2Fe-2S domain-containing protein [Gemmatimonadetes bacterium]|nr:Rieske 2Fe-2S domain-containing protein [Gemmatimonadota bacterium]
MNETRRDAGDAECAGCELGRRAFLRDASIAFVALAATGASAAAMPLRAIEALSRYGRLVTYPIPAADGVSIDKANETIVSRVGGKVFVFALTCPHQNTALKWLDGDKRFQCPKHSSKYTPEGVYIEGRATRSMDRFAVTKSGNTVAADLDKLYEEDQDGDKWKTAFITV